VTRHIPCQHATSSLNRFF